MSEWEKYVLITLIADRSNHEDYCEYDCRESLCK